MDKEIIEQIKENLLKVERVATMPTPAWADFREALSLLESAKAEQPVGKFTKECRIRIISTFGRDDWTGDAIRLWEACARLDAQQQEIERLVSKFHAEKASYESARTDVCRLAAENKRLEELIFAYESTNYPINPLLAKNKAQAERIEELEEDNRKLMGRLCQLHEDIEQALQPKEGEKGSDKCS